MPLAVTLFPEPIQVNAGETLHVEFTASKTDFTIRGTEVTIGEPAEKPKLKVHQPEPAKKVHAVFDDIEFDDDLIAKMMANIAANGMKPDGLGRLTGWLGPRDGASPQYRQSTMQIGATLSSDERQ